VVLAPLPQDPPEKKVAAPSKAPSRSSTAVPSVASATHSPSRSKPVVAPPTPARPAPKGMRESARVSRLLLIAASALVVTIVTAIAIQRGCRPTPKQPLSTPNANPVKTAREALNIGTEPSGALVSVDGAAGVRSPFEAGGISPGMHVLTAVLDGYQTRTDTITFMAGSDTMVTLALLPLTKESLVTEVPLLLVKTKPPGAMVTVGSRGPRSSPARFTRVPAGRVPLRIRADGYAPLDTVVTLAVGRDTTFRFALAALPAGAATAKGTKTTPQTLAPSAQDAPGAKAAFTFRAWPWADVYVDDKLVLSKADTARVAVAAGRRLVEFRNPVYEPIRQKVQFKDGQTERLYAAFYTQTGWITVTTADGGPCTVLIDGQAMPAPAPALYEVKPGRHRVRAQRQGVGATEGEKEVRLHKNDRVQLKFGFASPATAR
jgi:PEGA domain-containing protein